MTLKVPVIVVTDGDKRARRAVRVAAGRLGLDVVDASGWRETPVSPRPGEPRLPLVVIVDDRGDPGYGPGEAFLEAVARSPRTALLGVVAVASKASDVPVFVTRSLDAGGGRVTGAVDKDGVPTGTFDLLGDGCGVLRGLGVPTVGIGDPGRGRRAARIMEQALVEVMKGGSFRAESSCP